MYFGTQPKHFLAIIRHCSPEIQLLCSKKMGTKIGKTTLFGTQFGQKSSMSAG
jgi:hypothetical protein